MSQPVTLFCSYSKEENRTTNYCLVVLKMLYLENRKLFADTLSALVGKELGEEANVEFEQQVSRGASTPDGLIRCSAFTVFIETKTDEPFNAEQLGNHLAGLNEYPGVKFLIALSNFEGDEAGRFQRICEICRDKYGNSLAVRRVSFWDFLMAIKRQQLPNYLENAAEDFRYYLKREYLLPSWERYLFAVNCTDSLDVLSARAYLSRRTWEYSRCKFFGSYEGKYVRKVAMIEACVDIEDDQRATIIWQNVDCAEVELKILARSVFYEHRSVRFPYPTRVVLLGPSFETKFRNVQSGWGYDVSCDHFDVGALDVADTEALAVALNGMVWWNGSWEQEVLWERTLDSPPLPKRLR